MLKEYEFTLIAKSDLGEGDKAKFFEKYENVLLGDGGQIIKKEDWGVKRLAFPMKKQHRGHYMHYDFAAHGKNLAEAERLMRIDDNVLRFLSLKLADKVDVEKRKAEIAKKIEEKAAKAQENQDN